MASPAPELIPRTKSSAYASTGSRRHLDFGLLTGIAVSILAVVAGIGHTGVALTYFYQPTDILIVFVGTLGVTIVTTPRAALAHTARRALDLLFPPRSPDRDEIIENIVAFSRMARTNGTLALEPIAEGINNPFLRDGLLLALDLKERQELESALDSRIRLQERQGEADAKVVETAGGFAPTIGVMGTVVGLIDVLRHFTSLSAVASGMGIAFVSTIYGLGLANLVLLPAAHRMRARIAEVFDLQLLMAEGILCVFDGVHPRLIRQRLSYFRPQADREQLLVRKPTAVEG